MATDNLATQTATERSVTNGLLATKASLERETRHETPAVKPKSRTRRILRFLFLGSVYLLAIVFIAKTIWRFSGSNQWELIGDKNGVKVYSLKAPGMDMKQFKSVFTIHSTLAGLVTYFQDPSACRDVGCLNAHELERVNNQLQYSYFQFKLPFPFRTREFVVRQQFFQNPNTKEVLAEFVAAPDKAPPNDCCVRVTEMNNRWRLTPLGNGDVEVEYVLDMNEGGFIPDILLNLGRPKAFFQFKKLQDWVGKAKYQNAKVDFIQEK